jgi:DivIVA domain-containing protein
MTGDEIRRAQFREVRRDGYSTEDVDSFLVRLAQAADLGQPLAPLVAAAQFRAARRHGYHTQEVDRFLDQAALAG